MYAVDDGDVVSSHSRVKAENTRPPWIDEVGRLVPARNRQPPRKGGSHGKTVQFPAWRFSRRAAR